MIKYLIVKYDNKPKLGNKHFGPNFSFIGIYYRKYLADIAYRSLLESSENPRTIKMFEIKEKKR